MVKHMKLVINGQYKDTDQYMNLKVAEAGSLRKCEKQYKANRVQYLFDKINNGGEFKKLENIK